MGHFDIDGVRYWDAREEANICTMYKMPPDIPDRLPSDSTVREDSVALLTKSIEEA